MLNLDKLGLNKFDLNKQDTDSYTPLALAAKLNHYEAVTMILEANKQLPDQAADASRDEKKPANPDKPNWCVSNWMS